MTTNVIDAPGFALTIEFPLFPRLPTSAAVFDSAGLVAWRQSLHTIDDSIELTRAVGIAAKELVEVELEAYRNAHR